LLASLHHARNMPAGKGGGLFWQMGVPVIGLPIPQAAQRATEPVEVPGQPANDPVPSEAVSAAAEPS
jgi:hypothetical protein